MKELALALAVNARDLVVEAEDEMGGLVDTRRLGHTWCHVINLCICFPPPPLTPKLNYGTS